jgi:hypothetical protein
LLPAFQAKKQGLWVILPQVTAQQHGHFKPHTSTLPAPPKHHTSPTSHTLHTPYTPHTPSSPPSKVLEAGRHGSLPAAG